MGAYLKACIPKLLCSTQWFCRRGNRCYWQGGFYEAAAARMDFSPSLVVGASAFAAVYLLPRPATRARMIGVFDPQLRNFDFAT